MLPVPQFSRGIGLVLIRRCGKKLAVAGCDFFWLFVAILFRCFELVFEVTTSLKAQDNGVWYGGCCLRWRIFVRKTAQK